MHDLDDVFSAFGTVADLAAELGVPYQTAAAWKQRRSIPAKYFSRIVEAAQKRGSDFVTLEFLMALRADTALSMPKPEEDEGDSSLPEIVRRAVAAKKPHKRKP